MSKQFSNSGSKALVPPIILVGIMWIVYLFQQTVHPEIVDYGVRPLSLQGLIGIFTSPFIHSPSGYDHIINNSIPMLVLTWALFYFYWKIALKMLFYIMITTGLCVWMGGQPGTNHIGMSGVIYGLAGFLFFSGVFRKHSSLMALSLLVVFEYGSMIWGVFPIEKGVSWESHLWGLVSGGVFAYYYRLQGPQRKKYQWEIEEELGLDHYEEKYWEIDSQKGQDDPKKINYVFKPDPKTKKP